MILLCGCQDTKYFSVTTSASSELGIGTGGSKTELAEGTSVTLQAIAHSQNNPFLCWIKNDGEVFSKDAQKTITVNSQTQGHYSALFQDTNKAMPYATLSQIAYTSSSAESIEYTLELAPLTNIDEMRLLSSGQSSQMEFSTFTGSVFKTIYRAKNIAYSVKLSFSVEGSDGNLTNYPAQYFEISNDDFNTEGIKEVELQFEDKPLTLTFSKLTAELLQEI